MKVTHSILLLAASVQIASAQGPSRPERFVGYWFGALHVSGLALKLGLTVTRASDGSLDAFMTSIDQGNARMTGTTAVHGDTLIVSLPGAHATYTATLNAAGDSLSGTFLQSVPIPLTMGKTNGPPVELRPQEPKPPYPYDTREVSIPSAAGVTLAGTLSVPKGAGPFPAVVLVTGSGPQDRNEEIMGHKPFLVISDYLTRRGIAVLRYDDRGVAKSTGVFAQGTTADFANDAEAAVKFLEGEAGVDSRHVGIIGHSEGGTIAAIVAARSKDVAFIVMLAGTGLRGDSLLLLQQAGIARVNGAPEPMIALGQKNNRRMFAAIVASHDSSDAAARLTVVQDQMLSELPPEGKTLGSQQLAQARQQILTPWYIYFIKYDPAVDLRKVHVPVLAMNGTRDLQVPSKENLPAIKAALAKGGNRNVEIFEVPGVNHLFQTTATGNPAEYGDITETFSPVALERMATWIARVVATKPH